ncbi:MAG: protein-L-isoaspartate(D-aspartate) O-methyltransferase [Candidatus Omnitrophota bacterium]|nr:protein-L-isoaspartate(D-aspartate) O-methyltransferase [Candidatus Omnitrophota bacterium]
MSPAPAIDFDKLRAEMVLEQLIPRNISEGKVLEAFRKVPRQEFVPEDLRQSSYNDYPLPIGDNQTISQPYMVALMTECLKLKGGEKVLEIGTGSGYQAAILGEIAGEVYSVERFKDLADKAGGVLSSLGYKNIHIKVGDGTLGWSEFAPYDGIVVTAGAPSVPDSLVKQLKDGGSLVIPVDRGGFSQVLTLVERVGRTTRTSDICACTFVPLVGKEGWKE